jgi:hypothetical protein
MRVHPSLVFVSALLVAAVVEGAPPEPDVDDTLRYDITATRVAVHVYSQVTDLSDDDERRSLAVAREVFSSAAVDIAWTSCKPGMCEIPAAEVLKLRIAVSRERGDANAGVLGQALIDSRTRTGVLATVFIDRTRRLASALGLDYRVLLGRAIAHELAHLMLGTSTHGSGLMREIWLHDELLGTRRDDWALDPSDAAVIRDRLARRGLGRSRGAS